MLLQWQLKLKRSFVSSNYSFHLAVLKKNDFSRRFVNWTDTILKRPDSSVIIGDRTTQCYQLSRRAC